MDGTKHFLAIDVPADASTLQDAIDAVNTAYEALDVSFAGHALITSVEMYKPVLAKTLNSARGDIDFAKTVVSGQLTEASTVTPVELYSLVNHTTFANGHKFHRNNTEYVCVRFSGGA